jgi:hypothetical protein
MKQTAATKDHPLQPTAEEADSNKVTYVTKAGESSSEVARKPASLTLLRYSAQTNYSRGVEKARESSSFVSARRKAHQSHSQTLCFQCVSSLAASPQRSVQYTKNQSGQCYSVRTKHPTKQTDRSLFAPSNSYTESEFAMTPLELVQPHLCLFSGTGPKIWPCLDFGA